jgi:hypothetical protein
VSKGGEEGEHATMNANTNTTCEGEREGGEGVRRAMNANTTCKREGRERGREKGTRP